MIFGGLGTGGSTRTEFRSIACMDNSPLPVRNRSAPCAISSGRVPGKQLSRSVRPYQPEPSSAAIPGTPSFSKLTMRIGFLKCRCEHAPQRHRFVRVVIWSGRASINNPFPSRLHKFRHRPSMLPSPVLASPRSRRSSRTHGLQREAPLPWN
jgi:hypothetical protein